MLLIKYVLLSGAAGLFVIGAAIVIGDAYRALYLNEAALVRWRVAMRLALLAWVPLLVGLGIEVVPSGRAGVRVSQISGTLAGTLYPGTHFVMPLVHGVELYNIRDQIYSTDAVDYPKIAAEVAGTGTAAPA